MSTYADKSGLTSIDPLNIKYEIDGDIALDEAKNASLSGDDIIKKLGKAVHVKCCPTGSLEYAGTNDVEPKVHTENCCTAVEATIKALTTRMSVHPPKFLILSGSLREESYSRKVALEAGRILATYGAEVKMFNPVGLPLFSTDVDPSSEPKVVELRSLIGWCEGMVWVSPEVHGNFSAVFKNQVDWMPLSIGAIRPTQGKTCAVMQVEAGSQSFNTVNNMRVLGRWMRMVVVPNQASIPRAYTEFDDQGLLKASSLKDRVVDVIDELFKYTLLLRDQQPYLLQRYSEVNAAAKKNLEATEKPADANTLAELCNPLIIDVRSAKEVAANKGGEAVLGSVHVPLNVNNDPQSVHITTKMEFKSKLIDAGIVLEEYKEKGFITHCSAGDVNYIGRGARAAALLRDMGYQNAYNGGDANLIRAALNL